MFSVPFWKTRKRVVRSGCHRECDPNSLTLHYNFSKNSPKHNPHSQPLMYLYWHNTGRCAGADLKGCRPHPTPPTKGRWKGPRFSREPYNPPHNNWLAGLVSWLVFKCSRTHDSGSIITSIVGRVRCTKYCIKWRRVRGCRTSWPSAIREPETKNLSAANLWENRGFLIVSLV